jgi:hypothetical protein
MKEIKRKRCVSMSIEKRRKRHEKRGVRIHNIESE